MTDNLLISVLNINLLKDYFVILAHHFIYEEIEAQRKAMICPKPHHEPLESSHGVHLLTPVQNSPTFSYIIAASCVFISH